MTYSIVALDPANGELGVAVQTAWPSVGATTPWVEPGIGAVATQSFTNVDLGPGGLAFLRGGSPAPVALRDLVALDPGRDIRQIGIVDRNGRAAAHTGTRCVAVAGHRCVPGVSVQGNLLGGPHVLPAMLDAFLVAPGDLADRLMAALRAGEVAGGDIRGSQSAALVVAPGPPGGQAWSRRYDLRIDTSAHPLGELARLLKVARAYEALDAAMGALEPGGLEEALSKTTMAHRLAPNDAHIAFWHALALIASDRPDDARALLEAALRAEPRLAEFGHRFAHAGHAGVFAAALERVADLTGPAEDLDNQGSRRPAPSPTVMSFDRSDDSEGLTRGG